MGERYKEVMVDGKKKVLLEPEYGKDYWLGYHRARAGPALFSSQSVHGVYFGIRKGEHLFLNISSRGELEKFSCPAEECYLNYCSDGKDGPAVPALDAFFQGIMKGIEADYAIKVINKVRKRNLERRAETASVN